MFGCIPAHCINQRIFFLCQLVNMKGTSNMYKAMIAVPGLVDMPFNETGGIQFG